MKRLLLLRHAKAVPHGTVNDFDRRLADQGHRDMEAVAHHLAGFSPDFALVSPAARTRETWEACALPEVKARFEEAIYEASPPTLLHLLRMLPDTAKLPVLVGHNPGLEELASMLKGGGKLGRLPPGGLVLTEWSIEEWRSIAIPKGRFVTLATPASLDTARANTG